MVPSNTTSSKSLSLFQPALPLVVAMSLILMIAPIPPSLLDLLLALNVAFSLLVLLIAVDARKSELSRAWPTLLLVTTLMRIGLNVASSRLILLHGHAGKVIQAFGEAVVQGNYIVGAVVFIILGVAQWIVIAKGGERIAEVAARFSLDAMPGRQLATDLDYKMGALAPSEVREKRHQLDTESQWTGMMDGAMKFVKGDAALNFIIVGINLVAGAGIGTAMRGQSLSSAMQTYGVLSIGDGLVSMIPSLFMAMATAFILARSAHEEASFSSVMRSQLSAASGPLFATATIVIGLSLLSGFPFAPFALAGLSLVGIAFYARTTAPKLVFEAPKNARDIHTTHVLLRELEALEPSLVKEVIPSVLSIKNLSDVLRKLDDEKLGISHARDLKPVLDELARCEPQKNSPDALLERARLGLRSQLAQTYALNGGLDAIVLTRDMEDWCRSLITRRGDEPLIAFGIEEKRAFFENVEDVLSRTPCRVMVTHVDIRRVLWQAISSRIPDVHVLSFEELAPSTSIRPVDRLDVPAQIRSL